MFKMAETELDSVNSSTCAALKEVISHKSECQNCIVVKEQFKKDLMEPHSAQLISEFLQEKMSKNPQHGSIELPSIGVRECTVANNHGDWNLVNLNHVTKTSNLVRHTPVPGEASNRYSLLDNFQGTFRNPNNGDIRNGIFIIQVIPNVNHSFIAKIYHNK
jgi:hypothetical protein